MLIVRERHYFCFILATGKAKLFAIPAFLNAWSSELLLPQVNSTGCVEGGEYARDAYINDAIDLCGGPYVLLTVAKQPQPQRPRKAKQTSQQKDIIHP